MINKLSNIMALGAVQLQKLTAQKLNELIECQQPIILVGNTNILWDLRKGYNAKLVLTSSKTLLLNQLTAGDYGTIELIQDNVGSRTLTLPSNSKVSNGGSGILTLSTAANSIDIASFYFNGTILYWNISLDFS